MIADRIKVLENGVYEFSYINNKDEKSILRFSIDTLCCINITKDYIIIKEDESNNINGRYVHDFKDRVDYLLLGLTILHNKELFGNNDNIIYVEPDTYMYISECRIINLDNIRFAINSNEAYIRGTKENDSQLALIYFDSIFGLEIINKVEYNIIIDKLNRYLNNK
ncbi:MAG: hypothetical protein J6D03_07005 [Clostridia bacterium]|nr:hypothetical protein [Clostridia bacterium]